MQARGAVNRMQGAAQLRLDQAVASSGVWRLTSLRPNPGHSTILLTCLSLCNTQARTVNLIHAILCDVEGDTQARGCQRHETGRGVERWHCTIYCLEFCAGFNDAKRQHLSTIKTNSDLSSFTKIQQQTYRRKQSMDQTDDNSLTALLTKRAEVRFREVVNTCTERRAEKRIQRTPWILSHVLRKTLCEHVNGLCPSGLLNEQYITKHWFQSVRTSPYSWATGRNTGNAASPANYWNCYLTQTHGQHNYGHCWQSQHHTYYRQGQTEQFMTP